MTHQTDDRHDQEGRAHRTARSRPEALAVAERARNTARLVREQARAARAAAEAARGERADLRPSSAPTCAPTWPDGPPASRALWTRGLLGDMWGDDLPTSADPWLTLVQDTLALDDEAGRERGFAVYADALRLDALEDVLVEALAGHPHAAVLLTRLPGAVCEPVRQRLQQLRSTPPHDDRE